MLGEARPHQTPCRRPPACLPPSPSRRPAACEMFQTMLRIRVGVVNPVEIRAFLSMRGQYDQPDPRGNEKDSGHRFLSAGGSLRESSWYRVAFPGFKQVYSARTCGERVRDDANGARLGRSRVAPILEARRCSPIAGLATWDFDQEVTARMPRRWMITPAWDGCRRCRTPPPYLQPPHPASAQPRHRRV